MKYVNKVNEVSAFQYDGVNSLAAAYAPEWITKELDEERLYIAEYGKEGKIGLFYSKGGKAAYKRYYVRFGSYLVKWPDGTITSVDKSVFERMFEPKEEE